MAQLTDNIPLSKHKLGLRSAYDKRLYALLFDS
jgi:hypothetical protein